MHLHTALRKRPAENPANLRVVSGKDFVCCVKQVEVELPRVFATLFQFVLEPELHCQGELNTTGTRSDNRHRQGAFVVLDPGEQRKPAVVETGNRLYWHRMVGGAFHFVNPRRRTNVDGKDVVGHVRTPPTDNPLAFPVDAHGFGTIKARTCVF